MTTPIETAWAMLGTAPALITEGMGAPIPAPVTDPDVDPIEMFRTADDPHVSIQPVIPVADDADILDTIEEIALGLNDDNGWRKRWRLNIYHWRRSRSDIHFHRWPIIMPMIPITLDETDFAAGRDQGNSTDD